MGNNNIIKFENFSYSRPNLEQYKEEMMVLVASFKAAQSADNQIDISRKIWAKSADLESSYMIAAIRHSINTKDDFYEKENQFFDEKLPELQEYSTAYYKALLASPFRDKLEQELGQHLFTIADFKVNTFDASIVEDLKEVNRLSTTYSKLKAQAKLEFEGETYNLSSIDPILQDKDRERRSEASAVKWQFFEDKQEEFDQLYTELVERRHRMARSMGYENYIDLGYKKMMRSDYNATDVKHFRKQIQEHIVPLASKLYQRQAKRLGLEKLKHYDEKFKFPSGNPTPKGGETALVNAASTMYKEFSPETDQFFTFLQEKALMDLSAKNGKQTGGYCTFIHKHAAPFIFSNFNGTSQDVTVLTHEAGHAFQCYSTHKNHSCPDYLWPSYEACEIHSMSMEFFTWPWMSLFFKEDTEKFLFEHLSDALLFLPYGTAVDEFQHEVYAHPTWTAEQRNAKWKELEKKYLPELDYTGNNYLESGRKWQRQAHIYNSPFYYIDYVLAQICAFQFWKRFSENKQEAWADYITLCKAGGSLPFLDLVKLANLKSPFEEGTIKDIITFVEQKLDAIDDQAF